MDTCAIASASIGMSLSQTQQAVSTAMLKKTMDQQKAAGESLVQSMAASAPSFGHQLDVRA